MNHTKTCTVCQETFPATLEYFSNKKGKLLGRCKKCLSLYNKKYYQKHQSKIIDNVKKFKEENPEYMKEWRSANKEKVSKQRRSWIEKNREFINSKERLKRKNNPHYKVKKNLRRRVNQVITRNNKSQSTMKLTGCSIEELLKHLESKFIDGMNWQNYGEWHIDHILPCSSFDLTDPEQQKRCFHYTNLQPLWALDNIRKGNKIPEIF
jgi:superfamily II DNA helicase RecQ